MEEKYYFGIDGGGTHSRLSITDAQGKSLCRVTSGSTNIYSVAQEKVFENLSDLFSQAFTETGLEKKDITRGCIGSAGLARPAEQKLFRGFFADILGPDIPVLLCTDGEILLCGGLGGLEGYCLIAGTGSVALGRAEDGRLVRAGGLGYMLGDEGSASWTGKEAIIRAMRSLEHRDLPTSMMESILKHCGLEHSYELVQYIHHTAGKAEIATLAPLVTEAARNKDPLAEDILRRGAEELALLVASVLEQSPWIGNRTLVLAGGVMEHDEIVRNKLESLLKKQFPDLTAMDPKGTALEGACILAMEGS
ncbi:N-acetylglucosamine kinase [Breznakiella homolactica]|uniref:ATPase BadF/BadG/BcrA/BcrD type domain-containing protein n=1 Tax=Breznakiella homolactica TaxID=2798577 RepID=A0A7T7XMG3_9SPIR|nr:BadF/BadG/BcrA/BcrD ATPase family protein [Breznakiella homolactica]QQO08982.1 hypothetical protein JFL75_18935 [Breznakiella homolactica]